MFNFFVAMVGYTPADTAFAFDLHEVLFERDLAGWVKLLGIYGLIIGLVLWAVYSWCGIRGVMFAVLPGVLLGGDFLVRISWFRLQHGYRPVIEHVCDSDLALRALKPLFVQFENLYLPNEQVFKFVKALKEGGYELFIASNVAPETLKSLQRDYRACFSLFDGIVSPTKENEWLDKKQPKKFFSSLKSSFRNKNLVLIDDKQENCDNAQKEGIDAICFKGDIKNLRLSLQEKGVLLSN